MTAENANVILVVKEIGLRGTLAARLTLCGASVMTADSFGECAGRRIDRRRATVVLDHAAYDADAEHWSRSLDREDRWRGVLVLTARDDEPGDRDGRVAWARKEQAIDRLCALLQAEDQAA